MNENVCLLRREGHLLTTAGDNVENAKEVQAKYQISRCQLQSREPTTVLEEVVFYVSYVFAISQSFMLYFMSYTIFRLLKSLKISDLIALTPRTQAFIVSA